MSAIFTNDHFLLGLGLAAGPAIIICFAIFMFFRHRSDLSGIWQATNTDGTPICNIHSGVANTIAFLVEECKNIWLEVKEVNKRQITLRERLPAEYVSKDDLRGIHDRLGNIDSKLDRYMEITMQRGRE